MAFKTIEDYDRLAHTNEDRFEQVEVELNRALELLEEGKIDEAKLRVDQAAHIAGKAQAFNLQAMQP